MKKCAGRVKHPVKVVSLGLILSLCVNSGAIAEIGVTNDKIIIGGVMDLEGRSRGLGQGMREGIVAALSGQKVKGRSIEYVTLNDSYNPSKTIAATQDLVGRGIFAMLGNVGTPTAKVSLPLLERSGIPAVGFFTGAGLLRPGKGDVVNYRASYVQETAAVINAGLDAGLKADEICAYVQNDAYGMAGIAGVKAALKSAGGSKEVIQKLDEIIALGGDNPFRNNVGPVGVYKRNTFSSRDGYNSLKAWETNAGVKCRLVVTVGAYASIANFIGYATMKGEEWIYSAVSFTGAENLKNALAEFGVKENIIVTQVVPPLNSKLQVVKDARKVLGSKLNYVNLEGYVVGRFLLEALKKIPGKEITRDSLLSVINGNKFNIGGLALDYSNDNQGSDLVIETYLADDRFKIASAGDLKKLFR
ncbi:MAG: ABC transporter substrate-binding protein [Gammaproteobacteria bacterium]|nr:ABC transporter substrate-binding protein [Gammaproteobacteria bacterium]